MENNENLVVQQETEQTTENVETATEESVNNEPEILKFTKEEFDSVVGKKKARAEAKVRRELEKEYGKLGQLAEMLKAGTGKDSIDDIIASLSGYYDHQGKAAPAAPQYSERDIEILARAEADDIIRSGPEEVVEELDRLNALGKDGMTAREKALFRNLFMHQKESDQTRQLQELGIPKEVYESKEFKDLAAQFKESAPIRTIYDIYQKLKPQKEVQTPGSVKNTGTPDDGIKEFYTPDEARKFTKKDFDKNPKLWENVLKSAAKWKK